MAKTILPFNGREIHHCSKCGNEQEEELREKARQETAKQKQEWIDRKLHNAMISPRFKEKTFENYKAETAEQKKALTVSLGFIESWNQSVGLMFIGGPGTGKNHLASALVKAFIKEKDKTALMTEAIKIIRAIKESWKVQDKTESQAIKSYTEPDLLVIDEVGVQFGTETEKMFLTEIINDRYNAMKPTILIGNVTLEEMKVVIGERVVERFKEGGKVVVFNWQSYRGKTKEGV